MATLDQLNRWFAPFRRRIDNMVARAVLRAVNDAPKMQEIQIGLLDGETRGPVERFQNYGFSGMPPIGAEAVVVFVGGHRDHALAVAVDDRASRPTDLQAGEVMVYTGEDGGTGEHRIHFKQGKEICLQSGPENGARVTLKPDMITLQIGDTKIEMTESGITVETAALDIVKVV